MLILLLACTRGDATTDDTQLEAVCVEDTAPWSILTACCGLGLPVISSTAA